MPGVHDGDAGGAAGHSGQRQVLHLRLRVRHGPVAGDRVRDDREESGGRVAGRLQRHHPSVRSGQYSTTSVDRVIPPIVIIKTIIILSIFKLGFRYWMVSNFSTDAVSKTTQ